MLEILEQAERELAQLLNNLSEWNSLLIDYHPPIVKRLWRQWGDFRICLHRILPCESGEALFHPHPWPSAMRVLGGAYEMRTGRAINAKPPKPSSRIILKRGSSYEMVEPDEYHFVRPVNKTAAYSTMLIGLPYPNPEPAPIVDKPLFPLILPDQKLMFEFFRGYYVLKVF